MVVIALAGCAGTWEQRGGWAPRPSFEPAPVALEAAAIAVNLEDSRQTSWASHHNYMEFNPIVGRSPSDGTIAVYSVAVNAANVGVWLALPKRWKPVWSIACIALEGLVVHHNHDIGIPY